MHLDHKCRRHWHQTGRSSDLNLPDRCTRISSFFLLPFAGCWGSEDWTLQRNSRKDRVQAGRTCDFLCVRGCGRHPTTTLYQSLSFHRSSTPSLLFPLCHKWCWLPREEYPEDGLFFKCLPSGWCSVGICGDHSLEYAVTDPMSINPIFWLENFYVPSNGVLGNQRPWLL